MILTITDWAGDRVSLEPKVELYSVRDFMGKELPGLAIVLDKVGGSRLGTQAIELLYSEEEEGTAVDSLSSVDLRFLERPSETKKAS